MRIKAEIGNGDIKNLGGTTADVVECAYPDCMKLAKYSARQMAYANNGIDADVCFDHYNLVKFVKELLIGSTVDIEIV